MARRVAPTPADIEDYVSEGILRAVKAAQKWQDRGKSFEQHAVWTARHGMFDLLRKHRRRAVVRKVQFVEEAHDPPAPNDPTEFEMHDFASQHGLAGEVMIAASEEGRLPRASELMERKGLTREEADEVLEQARQLAYEFLK